MFGPLPGPWGLFVNSPARLWAVVSLLLSIASCGVFGPVGCDTYASALLRVQVLDQPSGQPVLSPLVVAFYSIAHGDSLLRERPDGVPQTVDIMQGEATNWRGGWYVVEVRADGYRVWRRERILVEEHGRCDRPDAPLVTARLQPL